ncbi:MAG TPA: carboxylesterase/lipase family protein [Candidatus Acidoferrum sp.]|nr:carboxylesterase/lipase family protein [Candidatus Acidoferrum sp.]
MKSHRQKWAILLTLLLGTQAPRAQQVSGVRQTTSDGILEGVVSADGQVRAFKGIPYAAPPVGPLRWKAPQPVVPWTGVRKAADYAPRAMQGRIYGDMIFRDAGPSEDCLYLNLWMPANPTAPKLPVMVWIHGGGFIAGSSSEPRQDGGTLCKKGVVVVSMNYRMGVFGFFAHPELTKESGHEASGNYGLLDQLAALQWVKNNIAAFGGDADNVTIFGESAGSFSVSALMASPLAHGLFRRAIGESGAFFGATLPLLPRAQAEESCVKFAESALGAPTLEALRAKPAQEVLDAALCQPQFAFRPIIDGYFLPADALALYTAGRQNHVPLLAGWNRDEGSFRTLLSNDAPTLDNFAPRAKARFGNKTDAFLRAYAATNDAQAKRAAQDFGGDQFIAYGTWKWMEMQLERGNSPVYRYEFDQTLPLPASARSGAEATAPHASEIEFVFRALASKQLAWRPEDREVSELMASYWSNFAKTGDPNGPGLPEWPVYNSGSGYQVMHIKANSAALPDDHRGRYEFLDHAGAAP